jgi:hypothetical protein
LNIALTLLTRYLYLTESSLSLEQHIRNNTKRVDSSAVDVDLRTGFPRLEWMSVEMVNRTVKQKRFHMRVELFSPVTLATLHARCRTPGMDREYYAFCLLRSYIPPAIQDPIYGTTDPDDLDIHEITSLVLHGDAGILASATQSAYLDQAFDIDPSSDFSLVVHDNVSETNARPTLQFLVGLAREIPQLPITDDEWDEEP